MIAILIDGLLLAAPITVLALVYGLLYGLLGVMDLTVAVRFGAAGLVGWWVSELSPFEPVLDPLALIGSIVGAVVVGAVTWELLAPLQRASPLALLVGSLGLGFAVQAALQYAFGAAPLSFDVPVRPGVPVLGTRATPVQLMQLGYALVACLGTAWVMARTRIGLTLELLGYDDELAVGVFGLAPRRIMRRVAVATSAMLAPMAYLYGLDHGISASTGGSQALLAFVATIAAGRGRPLGAALLAFLMVLVSVLLMRLGPASIGWLQPVMPYAFVLIVLLVRPRGLLARPPTRRV